MQPYRASESNQLEAKSTRAELVVYCVLLNSQTIAPVAGIACLHVLLCRDRSARRAGADRALHWPQENTGHLFAVQRRSDSAAPSAATARSTAT